MSESRRRAELARLEAMMTSEAAPDAAEAARVYEALRGDVAAQGSYDRLALALRAVEPGEERSAGERAFGEAAFLGALDEMLAQEEAPDDGLRQRSLGMFASLTSWGPASPDDGLRQLPAVISLDAARRRRAGAAAFVALAACVLAVWGVQRVGAPVDDGFAARSADPREAPVVEAREAQVALFCVGRDAAGAATFEGAEDAPLGALACDVGGELQVAYTLSAASRARYAAFFGVDAAGVVLWYGPSPAAPGPLGVSASEAPSPVGQTVRLKVNHRPGIVRVFGLFSEEPLELARVQGLLREPAAWLTGEGPREARRSGVIVAEAGFEVVEEVSP
jgi:hypothetical protein